MRQAMRNIYRNYSVITNSFLRDNTNLQICYRDYNTYRYYKRPDSFASSFLHHKPNNQSQETQKFPSKNNKVPKSTKTQSAGCVLHFARKNQGEKIRTLGGFFSVKHALSRNKRVQNWLQDFVRNLSSLHGFSFFGRKYKPTTIKGGIHFTQKQIEFELRLAEAQIRKAGLH